MRRRTAVLSAACLITAACLTATTPAAAHTTPPSTTTLASSDQTGTALTLSGQNSTTPNSTPVNGTPVKFTLVNGTPVRGTPVEGKATDGPAGDGRATNGIPANETSGAGTPTGSTSGDGEAVEGLAAEEAAKDLLTGPLAQPVWLCRPGKAANPCGQDAAGNPIDPVITGRYPDGHQVGLDATVIRPDGTTTNEPLPPPQSPKVDCFYAYPTVNLLANPLLLLGGNPPVARESEAAVTLTQMGRLTSNCRVFVPLYRQVALTGYLLGAIIPPHFETAYQDLKQAFRQYWTTDNIDPATGKRRGVILLGHSQGAFHLARLLQEEFDGNAANTKSLVAAYIVGAEVRVPVDAPSGGGSDPVSTFQHLPACERPSSQAPMPVGCVVAFNSADLQPGHEETVAFGRAPDPAHRVLCVNPAAVLAGGPADATTPMRPYMPTKKLLRGNLLAPAGSLSLLLNFTPTTHPTGFAAYADLATGRCARTDTSKGRLDWLQVDGLDGIRSSHSALGLHVLDYNVDGGGLAALAAAQAAAWTASAG
ncbi:DUF3089 domain-containing protein [Nonomuraea sp. NPDC059023]|uniref:DUF3089 domain-containing protein n=1 Tax=unclassified Nonomuraea TaxID=2593643 RepID=UPI003695FC92